MSEDATGSPPEGARRMAAVVTFDSYAPAGTDLPARVRGAIETHPSLSFRVVSVLVAPEAVVRGAVAALAASESRALALAARAEEAEGLLRSLEWSGVTEGAVCCPSCLEARDGVNNEHSDDCKVFAFFAASPADALRDRDARVRREAIEECALAVAAVKMEPPEDKDWPDEAFTAAAQVGRKAWQAVRALASSTGGEGQ